MKCWGMLGHCKVLDLSHDISPAPETPQATSSQVEEVAVSAGRSDDEKKPSKRDHSPTTPAAPCWNGLLRP